jgi:KUP system potassium uptake protein
MNKTKLLKLSFPGVLAALGIVYGDIGTSPLYVVKAITGNQIINEELVLGGLSCVFWTLTLITTFKYIFLALNADNKGEGGIFALYALLRKKKSGLLVIPAIIGCGTLIADGFITPSISISSAIEGLRFINPGIQTIPIIMIILVLLFLFQRYGTQVIGKTFGPLMMLWFGMISVFGFLSIMNNPSVLKAVNPYFALNLLVNYPGGFWVLGAVFLCTTGAEALYSDMGHCGKQNIRLTWIFVKLALLLSYFGQSAWLLQHSEGKINTVNPFYALMPSWFFPIGIAVATMATIIASQALISGVFSLVSQAIKLELWTELKIKYPAQLKGQVYLPAVNWLLLAGSIAVVLIFRESSNMESAYGLAIMINMLMTTSLLFVYLKEKKSNTGKAFMFLLFFGIVECAFFLSNLNKLLHGGWFSLMIALFIILLMLIVRHVKRLKLKQKEFVPLGNYLQVIADLQKDKTISLYAENLVYLEKTNRKEQVDANIIYSMLYKQPKRANIYWFLHIDIVDEPFTESYTVEPLINDICYFVQLKLGFKIEHKVHLMFMEIIEKMRKDGEIGSQSVYPSLKKHKIPPGFKFIVLTQVLSAEVILDPLEQLIFMIYGWIKSISLSKIADFGLDMANVEEELIPIKLASGKRNLNDKE